MKSKLTLLLTILSVSCIFFSFSQNEEGIVLPIKEAIKRGLIELKITGAYDSQIYEEIVDLDGVHFGKCMAIVLKSKTDSMISVRIDCGMELIPFDSTFQTMIVTKTVELPLYPSQIYATRFYAMCGQIHDNAPYIETTYLVGDFADKNTVKLARYLEKNLIQNMIGQHALWAYRDKVNFQELKKYGADSLTINLSNDILENLSLKNNLNIKKKKSIKTHDASIKVSKVIVYLFCGVLILLLLIIILLLIRSRK